MRYLIAAAALVIAGAVIVGAFDVHVHACDACGRTWVIGDVCECGYRGHRITPQPGIVRIRA